ncbi:MAG TPA: ABC transporter permease [Candidatus Acidoferrales bacterium]|nr:ABC transporter permease [Candidatus Acidoferrales bacterium]
MLTAVRVFASRLLGSFRRKRLDAEIEEEFQSHLQMLADRFVGQGMTKTEALRAARQQFGGVAQVEEELRKRSGLAFLDLLWQDLRYGLRMLRKSPGFTVVAVLTLALGIGANSTIFSWISSTLLNPIPGVTHTADLVTVMRGERSDHPTPPFSYLDYRDLRDHNRSFAGLLAYHDDFMSLTGVGKPERVYGALTSGNYFDVLGVHPILGRGFLPSEEQPGAAVAVISYALWQTHFGRDSSVIGKTLRINRHPYTIIGVAPPEFQGCKAGLRSDIWIPLGMDRLAWGANRPEDRATFWLNVLGRMRPGVTGAQAQADLNLLMRQIVEHSPDAHRGTANQITLDPLWRSPFGVNAYFYETLPMLLGLASVLLLLACANVANLLLVRSVVRRRELAIRLAIGATRAQLVCQLLVESLILGLAGGVVAIVMTFWTSGRLAELVPPNTLPLTLGAHVDDRVLLVTAAASIFAALIFGILPALRSSGLAVQTVLKEEAGTVSMAFHKSRLSSGLVVAQIAFSLLLLICAGLFTRSLENAQYSDPGFDPSHVLVASYELSPAGYTSETYVAFDRQLIAKLAALPGVKSVTLADFSPLSFTIHTDYLEVGGYVPQPRESMEISRAIVGPDYFHVMGTSLISGRDFTGADGPGAQPVAIVNQAFVDRYWPGQNAIGKRVKDDEWLTVVGVARNAKYRLLTYPPEPVVYLPLYQTYRYTQDTVIHLRALGDPQAMAFAVERAVHQMNPDLPLFDVNPLTVTMQMGVVFQRIAAVFAASYGVLAMLLAAVGIYGVVAYATRQRTREIGIRMALGSERADIFRLVLGQGLRLAVAGLAIGVALSLVLTRFLKSSLYGVGATDALTFVTVAIALTAVTAVACYIPARRAMRVDPMVALRHE